MNTTHTPRNIRRFPAKRPLERKSLGIACCRQGKTSQWEVLMICKRYTYAFHSFVGGRYNPGDNAALIALFDKMTIDEKIDLLSLNFVHIWYRIWLNMTQQTSSYFLAKNNFENNFVIPDAGARLRNLISKSKSSNRVWEMPKGRKRNRAESDVQCATREFWEETNIDRKSYRVLSATREHSFTDDGVKYTSEYHIAVARGNIEPKLSFSAKHQVEEISDIRWMNIEDIRRVDEYNRLETLIKPILNYVKKHA